MNKNLSRAAVAIILVSLLNYSVYTKQQSLQGKKAVIVDQLHGGNVEYGFTERCRELLTSNGYSVKVFKGKT